MFEHLNLQDCTENLRSRKRSLPSTAFGAAVDSYFLIFLRILCVWSSNSSILSLSSLNSVPSLMKIKKTNSKVQAENICKILCRNPTFRHYLLERPVWQPLVLHSYLNSLLWLVRFACTPLQINQQTVYST